MRKIFYYLTLLLICISCSTDDTDETCNSDCTTIYGKIIRADNTGISDVKVTFSFVQFAPYSYQRNIAVAYTDENGDYEINGFIKDAELGIIKNFQITIDIEKVESLLTDNFLKPSELLQEIVPTVNELVISGVVNRNEPINIVDFTVPYKSNLTVNLNNFEPPLQYDLFGLTNHVEYGFENQKMLTTFENVNQLNTEYNITTGIGNNELEIRKVKNGSITRETEIVMINSSPSNLILTYEY